MDARLMNFRKELESLINCHSRENGSNTPDFMLAEYLTDCLAAFDNAANAREKWYGREPQLITADNPPPLGPKALSE